jgi:AAA family ATP:ADP antiporter
MLGRLGCGFSKLFKPFFQVDKEERVKLALLTLTFFFVIASYTLVKELKDSIFMSVVGRGYLPWVKIIAIVAMVPAIFLYSFFVDKMRRYQLLALYSLLYGLLGLVFVYFIGHPTIGIANTVSNPNRIFGWLFYFFIEGYSPFIVGVFWAFANSITSPGEAKKNYGLMVAGSKLGGLLVALLAWFFLSPDVLKLSDATKHQVLAGASALLLLIVPAIIYLLTKVVPKKYLHGYEASYQLEKEQRKVKSETQKVSIFDGLKLLMQHPYVMGIFGFIFFYEVSSVVLDYQRKCLIGSCTTGAAGLSRELYWQMFLVHLVGCLFSLIGTSALMRKLGERKCLLLIPIVSGILFFYFIAVNTLSATVIVFVCLRALNYGFSYPVRESLYIPTVKEIKFKSKSWIDAFGTKIAKGFGSSFNLLAFRVLTNFGGGAFLAINGAFLAIVVGLWGFTAFLLGKRYQQAVDNNEVIGAEDQNTVKE